MPNIIVELRAEMTRVRQILTRLDPANRLMANNVIRYADENLAMNDLHGMMESLSDLRVISIKPKDSA